MLISSVSRAGNGLPKIIRASGLVLLLASCSSPLVQITPQHPTDTSTVKITCNGAMGNEGLRGYRGPVYVHLGLITDSSEHSNDWRYVKFKWGSTDPDALATPAGKDSWTYTLPNIRKFFAVKENEKPLQLAVLFRSGDCIDTFCKVLRQEDRTDILIPITPVPQ